MSDVCRHPIPLDELVAYHLGELTNPDCARIEEHYFACASCSRRLESVADLGSAIVGLVRDGGVPSTVTSALLSRSEASGLRIRRYHLAPGTQVACTAAPTDDMVVVHLGLDATPGDRVDLVVESADLEGGGTEVRTMADVAVDAEHGELVFALPGRVVRSYPRSVWTLHAVVHEPSGGRRVGPYMLDHTPWEQLTGSGA